MSVTLEAKPALYQRAKLIVVAALLMLSIALGVATSAQRADAKTVCYLDPERGTQCQVIK